MLSAWSISINMCTHQHHPPLGGKNFVNLLLPTVIIIGMRGQSREISLTASPTYLEFCIQLMLLVQSEGLVPFPATPISVLFNSISYNYRIDGLATTINDSPPLSQ